jgi:uncharacterized repeat protein (TIGR01451 family)
MSENVRSTSCRPSEHRSRRWITLMTIVAMFGFAGLVFANGGNNNAPKHASAPKLVPADPAIPGDDGPKAPGNVSAVPANDTCAGAIELFLGITQRFSSVDAADDYQTPATAACYPDLPNGQGQQTQVPTTAPGRDVVFKFTAPATDSYSFRIVINSVTNDFRNQNGVLYLVDGPGCFAAGTVSCLKGANRLQSRTLLSSVGTSDNHGEEVNCVSLTAGQTVYPVYDDANAGNAGNDPEIEVIKCVQEAEPNDTIAQANAYSCDLIGSSNVAPTAHCHGGANDTLACRRSGKLSATFVGQTDADCDPKCVGGPNTGLSCITDGFCNPGGVDVGAICSGVCVVDSVCHGGTNDGLPCTATCSGGPRAGQFCATGCNAAAFISMAITGTGLCVNPPITITGCGTGFACVQDNSCPGGGVCTIQDNEGDADFFNLGPVAAGSKIFTAIDANTSNDGDWRLRVTNSTDTLNFDDGDGNLTTGNHAPVIAGAVASGGDTYVKVSRSQPRVSEPYHLNAIVRPDLASAQLETEFNANGINNTIYYYWPGNTIAAEAVTAGGYLRGNFQALEADCFKFCVNKGDLMHWYGDGNPARTSPPSLSQLVQPIIYDSDSAGISNFIFGSEPRRNVLPSAPSAGLNGLSPWITSSYSEYRATYTGEIEVCFYEPSSRVTPTPRPGYAPGPWAASLGVNCGPVDDCTTIPADLSASKTVSPAGPYHTGDIVTYTIRIDNAGPGIAADVHFQDFQDPNTVYLGLEVLDGFDKDGDGVEGDNNHCYLKPTPGQNDAFVDCISASIAPGASVTYNLKVQINGCIGDVDIFNSATIDTRTPDPNTATCDVLNIFTGVFDTLPCENPSVSISATDIGTCNDLSCDAESCTANNCTAGDTCSGGVCNPGPAPNCDDGSICTEDSCDPATGCVNDSSQLGDLCDNGGADQCLEDFCDPVLFCQTRPVNCDDGNPCTDDSCDSGTGCVHVNNTSACSDGDACTTGDTCGGGTCNPGSAVNCDDGNACNGVETCDSGTGCVAGTPVVCTASDLCHDAGTCDTGTGLCSNPSNGRCHAQITSNAACSDFTSGTSVDLTQASYMTKGTAINSVTPGTAHYYSTIVAPSASFTITVSQAVAPGSACAFPNWPPLALQNAAQANLYSASCGHLNTSNSFDPGTGTLTMSVTGATTGETLILGVKYNTSSLKGTNVCRPHPTETYTISDSTGSGGSSDTLVLVPKN